MFLRLPSLATLVRAACTCLAWRRAVSSCRPFRRSFRALHPAPLLGLFFDPGSPAIPSFAPASSLDRDRLAAIRGGDFFLTSAARPADDVSDWDIQDCRGGYLLIANWDERALALALFNPLSWIMVFLDPPPDDREEDHRGYLFYLDPHLDISDEDPAQFSVISVCHDESRVGAEVFSSDTWSWETHPWVEITAQPHDDGTEWLQPGMRADGLVCWASASHDFMLMLDLSKMEFTVGNISLQELADKFLIGETKYGLPCVARPVGFTLLVQAVDSEGAAIGPGRILDLEEEVRRIAGNLPEDHHGLELVAIRDGFVYMATSELSLDRPSRCCFLTLYMETMKLEELFQRTYDGAVYPYIMPWPRFLVGDQVRGWA